jgi:hypothetical protein
VGLQAMVLGRLGIKPCSSSKSVCSILPIAICRPGLSGAPASIMMLVLLVALFLYLLLATRPSLCRAPMPQGQPALTFTERGTVYCVPRSPL